MRASAPRALVRRIHVDTDPGLDDLLALGLALASPELRVEGITTVAGNASIEAVTDNTSRFLTLLGLDVPLGQGAGAPLSLARGEAEHVHGSDGRRGIRLPEAQPRALWNAQELLRHSVRARDVEQIVALGPLTNIALLLREEPRLLEDVEIVWMGGTLGAGNATAVAEFNAWADPEAAAVVLGSGVPIRVIGLDVTQSVGLRPSDLPKGLFGAGATGVFLREIVLALLEAGIPEHGEPYAVLHDPSAVVACLYPDCFRYDRVALGIRVEEGRERGRLVPREARAGALLPAQYAVEVRAHDVCRLVLARLSQWCDGLELRE